LTKVEDLLPSSSVKVYIHPPRAKDFTGQFVISLWVSPLNKSSNQDKAKRIDEIDGTHE
jgi:hypothetical protein